MLFDINLILHTVFLMFLDSYKLTIGQQRHVKARCNFRGCCKLCGQVVSVSKMQKHTAW